MVNPVISGRSDIKMTMSHQDASGESRIDKMRKFLSSPLTRKKANGTHTKTFGTPLDVLVQKSPSDLPVPFVVTRICQYIEHDGLMHEGVFRISGNARLIERLKTCFDQTGDAPLETEGDVPSAAALLKLFFRELPDPIIPLPMHQQFLNAVKGSDREESVSELAHLVEKLPLINFSVLKYLSYFLTSVCEYESQNRMSASSVGIVFGPNLFRVTDDFVGLKEQSLTNQIVTYFITDYYAIFHDEPKYYKKKISSSLEAKCHGKMSMSTTDSMVASWPKLSAFPSITSSLNLRPLSVSIPTMGGSSYPLGSYAEPLDTQEHILMVDEYESVEDSSRNEQISDQSEKEESRDHSSSMRRKRKERKTVDEDDTSRSYDEVVSSESKGYWKDLYFIDDADDSVDPKNIRCSPEINVSPEDEIDQSVPVEAEPFYHRPFSLVTSEACKDTRLESDVPASYSLENSSDFLSPDDQRSHLNTDADMTQANNDAIESDAHTSRIYEELNSSHCYNTEFKALGDQTNPAMETFPDAREFPIDLRDDRPAREKRFGRSHKHYQRSGHRSYYRKKQHSGEGKRNAPSSQEFLKDDESGNNSVSRVENDPLSMHPPTDLAVTSNAFGESNGSSADQRYSWPVLKSFHEDDMEKISPARQFLRLSGNSEAPLSPSAYRSYLSHRSPHLDPNLPPSPPVEQEDLATGPMDDVSKAAAKLLSKKIQSLKKKIKRFEENFEASHSYRPSQAEKSQYPEIKKLIEELSRARQDLKQLKEEETVSDNMLQWTPSPESLPVPVQKYNKSTNTFRHSANQGFVLKDGAAVTIEQSLQEALEYLAEKRRSNQRPEALEDMSKEQLTEEKLSIQKLLLQFESIHGRPSSKTQRDTMRPLYDRYRCAKRILGRSASFGSTSKIKDATELQPILEHETMDFRSMSAKDLPSKVEEAEAVNNGNIVEKNENEIDKEINSDLELAPSPKQESPFDNQIPVVEVTKSNVHANLHELSLPELFEQQQQARSEKRKLRKILREFELEFQKEKGRKVQRDDKIEMESVYGAYKHVRARLKLLEALAVKHGQHRK